MQSMAEGKSMHYIGYFTVRRGQVERTFILSKEVNVTRRNPISTSIRGVDDYMLRAP